MWFEALPSVIAMGSFLSLVELAPMALNYLSWGTPMVHHSSSDITDRLQLRDQRIAIDHGVRRFAEHMYTYGLSAVDGPVKKCETIDKYIEAENQMKANQYLKK